MIEYTDDETADVQFCRGNYTKARNYVLTQQHVLHNNSTNFSHFLSNLGWRSC